VETYLKLPDAKDLNIFKQMLYSVRFV